MSGRCLYRSVVVGAVECNPDAKLMSDERPGFVLANQTLAVRRLRLDPNARRLSTLQGSSLHLDLHMHCFMLPWPMAPRQHSTWRPTHRPFAASLCDPRSHAEIEYTRFRSVAQHKRCDYTSVSAIHNSHGNQLSTPDIIPCSHIYVCILEANSISTTRWRKEIWIRAFRLYQQIRNDHFSRIDERCDLGSSKVALLEHRYCTIKS